MTTNNIAALKPGDGCYTFFLNPQGRIQADAYAWLLEDAILLETANPAALAELLDRFIIMDDVELEVVPTRAGLSLTGPDAGFKLAATDVFTGDLEPLELAHVIWQAQPVDILRTDSPLVPTFELWSDPATIGLLTESLRAAGSTEASPESLTQLRILSGIPLYGTDIRDKELPQETGQTRAMHFSKGCYLGQEIVERIHSRGNVHRAFTGFVLTGELPAPGTALTLDDKSAGELTSVTIVGDRTLALGYARREALEKHQPLAYTGGTAKPTPLPFAPPPENS